MVGVSIGSKVIPVGYAKTGSPGEPFNARFEC
jgi:hypothetical protein